MRRFYQVDVFASGPLTGNPLAVVAGADGLSQGQMLALARWTNLSETTFLLAPLTPAVDYRLRIFTPRGEIPFAGHPTLGSCHVWLHETGAEGVDRVVQECAAGLIDIRVSAESLAFAAPPPLRCGPLGAPLVAEIAADLRIARADVIGDQWADNGAGWAAVMLRDADAVLALEPGIVRRDIGVIGPHPPGGPADFEVRAFYPKNGATAEDPVTGSLNAALAEWLIGAGRASAPYRVRQGTALGHEGRVSVTQDDEGRIWIGGQTTVIVSGTVAL